LYRSGTSKRQTEALGLGKALSPPEVQPCGAHRQPRRDLAYSPCLKLQNGEKNLEIFTHRLRSYVTTIAAYDGYRPPRSRQGPSSCKDCCRGRCQSQKVTLFSNGARVAQGPVSTGVPGHPTPMGVFSVIEKDRYHNSNIYSSAPMPTCSASPGQGWHCTKACCPDIRLRTAAFACLSSRPYRRTPGSGFIADGLQRGLGLANWTRQRVSMCCPMAAQGSLSPAKEI
jgi:hypothetical protein